MVNSSLDKVNELLKLMSGDTARLEEIKKRLEKGKTLFNSDENYLQKLMDKHRNEIKKTSAKSNPIIDKSDSTNNDDELSEQTDEDIVTEKNNSSNKEKITCSNCGHVTFNFAQFCTKCGTSLDSNEKQSETSNEIHNISIPKKKFSKKKKTGMVVIISLAIIFAVIAGPNLITNVVLDSVAEKQFEGISERAEICMESPDLGCMIAILLEVKTFCDTHPNYDREMCSKFNEGAQEFKDKRNAFETIDWGT